MTRTMTATSPPGCLEISLAVSRSMGIQERETCVPDELARLVGAGEEREAHVDESADPETSEVPNGALEDGAFKSREHPSEAMPPKGFCGKEGRQEVFEARRDVGWRASRSAATRVETESDSLRGIAVGSEQSTTCQKPRQKMDQKKA